MKTQILVICLVPCALWADSRVLKESFSHVRNTAKQEWSSFPPVPELNEIDLTFDAPNPENWKWLSLRQAETKQEWTVNLNGQKLGTLPKDHNDQHHALDIPAGILHPKGNALHIFTTSEIPDDVRIGEISIHSKTLPDLAGNSGCSLEVVDEAGNPIPCRFTIVDADSDSLALLSATSNDRQAVRTGVVYALDGKLNVKLIPGNYRIYIGRGFEYDLVEFSFEVEPEQMSLAKNPIILRRQVPTPGLVACDPHLHTLEFAGHGDCSLTERLISLAGEGVELPISTEHDQHIDYGPEAARIGANRYFTPVVGCEVTTTEGHFNSWPIEPGATPAEHKLRPWREVFRNIYATPGVKICMLNHGRDLHRGFRPFDPDHWSVESGSFTDGRQLRANAMEVLNSGATKNDPLLLAHDWMALVRSGEPIAAFGSSDSHTVNFAIPGQGRTYLPIPDTEPGNLDVGAAVEAVLRGETYVSFGLLTKITLDGDSLTARVWGPDWTEATTMTLFVNGKARRQFVIPDSQSGLAGEKFHTTWKVADLKVKKGQFVVAIAQGPGITEAYWPMMPPYQKDSSTFEPYVLGVSAAVYPLGR